MPGYYPQGLRDDPRDLGDLERQLQRIESRLVSAEQQQKAVVPVPPPAPPPPISVNLFEHVNVKLVTAIGVIIMAATIAFNVGKWTTGSDAQATAQMTKFEASLAGQGAKFDAALIAQSGKLDAIAARIDRQNDSFYERMAFVFTDFCRRTERKNPNWSCAEPITMPIDPAAGKVR